jgi:hypothetical protein
MIQKLNNLLLSNAPLKIISLILGYTFWYIFSSAHTMSMWLTIPVCFYAMQEHTTISGPEHVLIKIAGNREYIRALDIQNLAAHVNAKELSPGVHTIMVQDMALLLPNTIKLVHCNPIHIEVSQTENVQPTTQG